MSEIKLHHPLFVFDFDDTITKCETLPVLARELGMEEKMQQMTDSCMSGNTPFESNFTARVALLNKLTVSHAQKIAAEAIPLHEEIARFISSHPERCLIMTGNLDVWIYKILEKLNMTERCLCSHAAVENDHIQSVISVLDKKAAAKTLPHPFIAIGDGDNDVGMLEEADYGIGFSGARKMSNQVRKAADIVISDEKELCKLLSSFLDT